MVYNNLVVLLYLVLVLSWDVLLFLVFEINVSGIVILTIPRRLLLMAVIIVRPALTGMSIALAYVPLVVVSFHRVLCLELVGILPGSDFVWDIIVSLSIRVLIILPAEVVLILVIGHVPLVL